ncbi:conserved hypothetical protein [Ricinus communis]|uniref:Uncharacterized protein n=1 Tax=Ricinus communis TaxID=3988 RepID=B9SDS7_RICCO|nr:conserved hypothetical protein [Ricinus communis]
MVCCRNVFEALKSKVNPTGTLYLKGSGMLIFTEKRMFVLIFLRVFDLQLGVHSMLEYPTVIAPLFLGDAMGISLLNT